MCEFTLLLPPRMLSGRCSCQLNILRICSTALIEQCNWRRPPGQKSTPQFCNKWKRVFQKESGWICSVHGFNTFLWQPAFVWSHRCLTAMLQVWGALRSMLTFLIESIWKGNNRFRINSAHCQQGRWRWILTFHMVIIGCNRRSALATTSHSPRRATADLYLRNAPSEPHPCSLLPISNATLPHILTPTDGTRRDPSIRPSPLRRFRNSPALIPVSSCHHLIILRTGG